MTGGDSRPAVFWEGGMTVSQDFLSFAQQSMASGR